MDELSFLTMEEKQQVRNYIEGDPESITFEDGPIWEKLYNHYVFKTGEMPHGTAKARTGDPHEWIFDRLEQILEA